MYNLHHQLQVEPLCHHASYIVVVRHRNDRTVLVSRCLRWTQFPKDVYALSFDISLFLWTYSQVVRVPGLVAEESAHLCKKYEHKLRYYVRKDKENTPCAHLAKFRALISNYFIADGVAITCTRRLTREEGDLSDKDVEENIDSEKK